MQTISVKQKKSALPLVVAAVALAALVVLNVLTKGKFLTPNNLMTIVVNASAPTFIAWAFVFLQASGFTDLSLGAAIIVAANVAGTFGNAAGYPGLVLGGLAAGVLLMTINFSVFHFTKIPSWIAGLGMTMIYEALAFFYSQQRLSAGLRVVNLENQYRALGRAPLVFIVMAIGLALAYFVYNRTTIGLNIRAVGSNQTVARTMGISMTRTIILSGIIAGLFVGMAAFVKESFAGTVPAVSGLASLSGTFQPLAAVLMAQALSKHINITFGAVIGTVFIMAVFNVLTLLGVPSGTWQEAVLGLSVIVFGIVAQKKQMGVVK
ncbi:MAG: hypothetical protein EOM52_01930 [Clostridia bacterium]|nr:hypothetical protein [Clostridia bacterium]